MMIAWSRSARRFAGELGNRPRRVLRAENLVAFPKLIEASAAPVEDKAEEASTPEQPT